MSFQFQLEGLLRVRRLLEQQARERLDEAMMRISNLEHRIEQATEWCETAAISKASRTPIPAGELQFVESILHQTSEAIAKCKGQKLSEEKRAAEIRQIYLLARRERKTVETLRENALREFQAEQSRREQLSLDEMFLGKLLYSRNNVRPNSEDSAAELNSMTEI